MALSDIVFTQANSSVASRGNTGTVANVIFDDETNLSFISSILYYWNGTMWAQATLKYFTTDGWIS